MPAQTDSEMINMDRILQQLRAENVNVATFLDEDIRPRQPPNLSNPGVLLRIGQPSTRILEPREYPGGILGAILNLVQRAGSVDAAKTALSAAVEKRKRTPKDPAATVRQVLPRDLNATLGMDIPKAPSDSSRKRVAVSPAADARPPKQQVADASNSNGEGGSNNIVKRLKDVPEILRDMLKTLSSIKQSAKPPSASIQSAFYSHHDRVDLFRLFMGAFVNYDAMGYEDAGFVDYQRLQAHTHKHYMFRHLADENVTL
ncbi:hypothetical protein IWX90DRAFT_488749 [Phyllosticta citrichinensis]|uniref:Uncharacterized protein n=1 Tax=Phyllosticta citrichinensis TaxID=1130410 RepID=A0ABR1XKV3_9PEZI